MRLELEAREGAIDLGMREERKRLVRAGMDLGTATLREEESITGDEDLLAREEEGLEEMRVVEAAEQAIVLASPLASFFCPRGPERVENTEMSERSECHSLCDSVAGVKSKVEKWLVRGKKIKKREEEVLGFLGLVGFSISSDRALRLHASWGELGNLGKVFFLPYFSRPGPFLGLMDLKLGFFGLRKESPFDLLSVRYELSDILSSDSLYLHHF